MQFYENYILQPIIAKVMKGEKFDSLRKKVLKDLSGTGLEVGFGPGLNLPFYPKQKITKLYALDPNTHGQRLAKKRLEQVDFDVEFLEFSGDTYNLKDNSLDFVVSTWTMCTIPDLKAALDEIYRVLKPGSCLVFLEHGLSPEEHVAKWQNRLNPIQKAIGGGCNLNRAMDQIFKNTQFEITNLDCFYLEDSPKILGYLYMGKALKN